MRLAVLADIHANRTALDAVLQDVASRGVDAVVCLGDVVGYGPDPEACVDLVRRHCACTVRGNHDDAVATGNGLAVLPRDGREAAERHREWLSADAIAWLDGLPLAEHLDQATLVHASPDAPEAWKRLDSFGTLRAQFAAFQTTFCMVGHSHRPALVADTLGVASVRPGFRYLIDVGSVGQPRDQDARAAYGLLDTGAVTYQSVRVPYDHGETARRIGARGLPAPLGIRLATGR